MRIGKRISVGLLSLALGFAAGKADAEPSLISATISSPDSGATVGIGGLVTVTASVYQSSADAELAVVAWLVSGGASATAYDVLFDATVSASADDAVLLALQDNSSIGNAGTAAQQLIALQGGNGGTVSAARKTPLDKVTGSTDATSFVAARQIKGTASGKAATGLDLDAGPLLAKWGDASSAAASSGVSGSDTYTYKISLKIPESAGNSVDQTVPLAGIRAAVVAYDPNTATQADKFSPILISSTATVGVDADRPSQEGIAIATDDGTGSTGNVYIQWANGNTNKLVALDIANSNVAAVTAAGNAGFVVDGFTTGPKREVAKTGDQIRVLVDLNKNDDAGPGPNENAIKSPGSTLTLLVDLFGSEFSVDKDQAGSVLTYARTVAAADFKDLSSAATTTTIRLYVVDAAGNKSSFNSAVESGNPYAGDDSAANLDGISAVVAFLADATDPVLTGNVDDKATPVVARVTPANGETMSDGTISDTDKDGDIDAADTRSVASDGSHATAASVDPVLSWHPSEDLKSVKVEFVGSSTIVTVAGGTNKFLNDHLASDAPTYLDITGLSSDPIGEAVTNEGTFAARVATAVADDNDFTATGDVMASGVYDIKVTPTDLAGNVGTTVTRTDVTIDFTEPTFKRRFPTKASFGDVAEARRDTVNATTANVTFALSETADSVKIIFDDIGGATADTFFVLSTAQLADTNEQTILTGPSLTDDKNYEVTIIGRDLAGNFTLAGPDTFYFNEEFVAPSIAKFVIDVVNAADPPVVQPIGASNPFLAGTDLLLRVKATNADGKTAVTFDSDAVVTITGNSPCAGCKITGDGVASTSDTTYSLTGAEFVVGQQTLTLTNSVAPETLSVTVSDAAVTYEGGLDSVIAYDPEAYSAIIVDAPAKVDQGEKFRVNVTLADKFGNTRFRDNRFVEVTSNVPGAQLPTGAIPIKKGSGWFDAVFSSGSTHTITVRDIVATNVDAKTTAYPVDEDDTGGDFISGSDDVDVNSGPVAWNLDAPDAVDSDDYMGASGDGDQGGFIILTFDASDDHATLDEYLIERQIETNYTTGATGTALAWVAWGSVAPTPGAETMYVVVATLDSDEAAFAVSAVRGGVVAKQAFSVNDNVSTPYELMARTMQNSRELAQISADAPVIATLAPEALAFAETGVVPRMKTGGEERSRQAISNPVRGVDNIPPAPVVFLKALDTASDLGGSITLAWSKSVDDQLLTQMVPNAVGGAQTYTVEGVKAYNIYRKVGDGEFALIGQAGSGETSFQDQTVFNGMPYTYQVRPSDTDNIAKTELVSSALAVRNNVRDAQGVLVRGLFGVDNRVDFDDFFVLADRFGLAASDASFDPAFDLSPNNKVDLDDFFVFVDNFGRSITGTGKVVPMLAGLNSDARLYIDAGSELPRIGEEMTLTLNLEDYVELRGYGLTVNYDAELLEFVGTSVDNGLLGEGTLAQPQRFAETDGQVSIGAFGDVASKGDLGVNLVFRSRGEIESSFIEITDAEVRDGGYGINNVPTPVSVRIETRPEVYALADNYPNPFNPETTLKYQLPESADVTLEIYNMLGQVVRTLVNENQSAGRYTQQWDGKNDNRHSLSSGIYFYRIQAGGEFQSVKKMLLVK